MSTDTAHTNESDGSVQKSSHASHEAEGYKGFAEQFGVYVLIVSSLQHPRTPTNACEVHL